MIFAQIVEECRSYLEDFGKRSESPRAQKKLRQYQGMRATFQKRMGHDPEDNSDVIRARERDDREAVHTIRNVGRGTDSWHQTRKHRDSVMRNWPAFKKLGDRA